MLRIFQEQGSFFSAVCQGKNEPSFSDKVWFSIIVEVLKYNLARRAYFAEKNLTALDQFYLEKEEPLRGCLLALKGIILAQDIHMTASWKYGMPFFCYKGKMFAYLWVHKKYKQPYIGIVEGKQVEHPDLIMEKRSRMKILLLNPEQDLPLDTINYILSQALLCYR